MMFCLNRVTSIIILGDQKNRAKRFNSVQRAFFFKKKLKVGINKMYSNCQDSYRPVIKGFMHYQHSSMQLVQKRMNRNAKLRATSEIVNIHQQRSPLG